MERIRQWIKSFREHLSGNEAEMIDDQVNEKQNNMNGSDTTGETHDDGGLTHFNEVNNVLNELRESLKTEEHDKNELMNHEKEASAQSMSWVKKTEETVEATLHERMQKMESKMADMSDMLRSHLEEKKKASNQDEKKAGNSENSNEGTPGNDDSTKWNEAAQFVHKEIEQLHNRLGTTIQASESDAHKLLHGIHEDMERLSGRLKSRLFG